MIEIYHSYPKDKDLKNKRKTKFQDLLIMILDKQ